MGRGDGRELLLGRSVRRVTLERVTPPRPDEDEIEWRVIVETLDAADWEFSFECEGLRIAKAPTEDVVELYIRARDPDHVRSLVREGAQHAHLEITEDALTDLTMVESPLNHF